MHSLKLKHFDFKLSPVGTRGILIAMSNHVMDAVAAAILGGKEQLPRPVAGPSRTGMKQPPRKFLTCMQKV